MMLLALGAVTTGGALVGSVVVARHRASAAADLAALAAAAQLPAGPSAACSAAEAIARSMAATVARCDVDGVDVIVVAEAAPGFGARWTGAATASARAGPVAPG
ncbi:hypothetical protein MCHUDSM44219_02673 [Mycolicibacterium chubuense]|uniref:Putative Flp pilus-assembly TadG-like N-terminal domain-containing protein n=1 Tax=Mycolicibacterium chubuense TaxID=1800 RepID=A0A0J6W9E3_MYCCU|nr:hypothetical protein MCHUDSM44219_02673 [Mycolicibacterium chubuense]SPX98321.1 helicase/secretion neighborhood TadE-like protein [Mycolicibacterium chubuense]